MSKGLRAYILIGIFLSVYTLLGEIATFSPAVKIRLIPGEEAAVSLIRLVGGELRVAVEFSGKGRRELGGRDGAPHYKDIPLEEVAALVIDISNGNKEALRYRAEPVSIYGNGYDGRQLVADIATKNEVRLPSRSRDEKIFTDPLFNNLKFKVVELGEKIYGEQVKISIEPSFSFKRSEPGIEWLSFFYFWPFYTGLYFIIFMMWLLVESVRKIRKRTAR